MIDKTTEKLAKLLLSSIFKRNVYSLGLSLLQASDLPEIPQG